MTSGLEAVGDAATGALAARALEPAHGEAAGQAHGACLNCGAALAGAYCQSCGQSSHLHRTITGFLHDLLHGVFHFDGKIWRTLPMLLFKPGELTRRYIAGERAKFVSPLAMFLFCVFLTFAVVGSLAGEMHAPEVEPRYRSMTKAQVDTALARRTGEMKAIAARISSERALDRPVDALDARRDVLREEIDALEFAKQLMPSDTPGGPQNGGKLLGDLKVDTGWATLDNGLRSANDNPNLFLYRLQTSAYKYSWLLIPISTPLVWLLFFWKRQYKVYDHLVFVTLSLTFMLLLVTALTIAGALGLPVALITLAALLIPPLHSYKQMRGAYLSGRITGLLRTGMLLIFGIIALSIYLIILLLLGVTH